MLAVGSKGSAYFQMLKWDMEMYSEETVSLGSEVEPGYDYNKTESIL